MDSFGQKIFSSLLAAYRILASSQNAVPVPAPPARRALRSRARVFAS